MLVCSNAVAIWITFTKYLVVMLQLIRVSTLPTSICLAHKLRIPYRLAFCFTTVDEALQWSHDLGHNAPGILSNQHSAYPILSSQTFSQ